MKEKSVKKFEVELHHLNYVANKKRSELEMEIAKMYLDLMQASHDEFDYVESPIVEVCNHGELIWEMHELENAALNAANSYNRASNIEFYKYLDRRDS